MNDSVLAGDAIMREMEGARQEIEVKLPFESAAVALEGLEQAGARRISEREFEDNLLFDREGNSLESQGRILRLRRCGSRSILTYKAPVEGSHRHKVRFEEETVVEDPEALERILRGLGFAPSYRYQKYRTEFELDGLHACLDETPLGCFVELEGAPSAIDRAAEGLGFTPEAYVCISYRDLHVQAAERRGELPGDLVFEESAGCRP